MTVYEPALRASEPVLLVCLPGTLCDGRAFAPLVDALRRRGMSLRSLAIDTAAAHRAEDVARLAMTQIAPSGDESIVIAGFSLGGMIAVHLARMLGKRARALLLLDMNGEIDKPNNASNRRAMVERARQNGLARFILEETWPTHVAASRIGDAELRDTVVAMANSVGLEGFARQADIAIARPRSIDIVAELDVPTLVLCGEEDRITPPALGAEIAAAAGNELVRIPDAGHFALLEQPDAIADSVMQWLFGVGRAEPRREAAASGQK